MESNRRFVIDCTLRDGGYYGNWDFDVNTVRNYLAAVSTARIDIIEIGFRFLPKNKYLGPFAYSTDEYLHTLPLPSDIPIAVMINAKDIAESEFGLERAINCLFTNKEYSPVDIVRIATHVNNIDDCETIARTLRALGYRVMLNLMQIDSVESKELNSLVDKIFKWELIDVLYFADSFGNLDPDSIQSIVETISDKWKGSIGIHTHDNKGLALSNCIAAMGSGVEYFDGTILGMGRGAGNVKTENLLVELSERGESKYYPDALFPLVLQEFKKLQEKYEWGQNLFYFLSATHGIHPIYIQEMLGTSIYGTDQILTAIDFLKSSGAPLYNMETMLNAVSGKPGNKLGSWSADGWLNGKEVLIIGTAQSAIQHMEAIKRYVKRKNLTVLCLNINRSVPEELVTAYVACHEARILIEADNYSKLKVPLIIPMSRIPEQIEGGLKGVDIYDYGLNIKKDSLEIDKTGCVLTSALAGLYAMAVAHAGGAKKIYLAGMDGYEDGDPRQNEMVTMFNKYYELDDSVDITAITPTNYPIDHGSVYEPEILNQEN